MNRMPQPGEIYQHFKGNLYRIVTVAEHTESEELLVVYQALYGDFRVYARPLAMFLDEVDHEKYPDAAAKQRFTLIPVAGSVAGNGAAEPVQQAAGAKLAEPIQQAAGAKRAEAEAVMLKAEEPKIEAAKTEELKSEKLKMEEPKAEAAQEEEFELDPRLLAFLEADSYEKKLEVYASLAGKVDEHLLNTIAVSLDLELSGDTLEEQYDTLKNCLLMLERYECNRLR